MTGSPIICTPLKITAMVKLERKRWEETVACMERREIRKY
jgi:hypothetical protein